MSDDVGRLTELLAATDRVTVFTGAGVSTASGIPDYRGPDGLWQQYRPPDFQAFLADESERVRYWDFYKATFPEFLRARPNPAHLALVEMERRGKLTGVITQNIDGLHLRAGHQRDLVVELHGTVWTTSCLDCGREWLTEEVVARVAAGERVPVCDKCGGLVKPATVSFGQSLPARALETAARWTKAADVFLVVGSSLSVYPAAEFPAKAAQGGAKLVIVNREPTPMDVLATLVVHASADEVLPRAIEALGK